MGWDQLEITTRLIAAAMLGGLIGIERGVRGRSAGLRTQMLVAVGAVKITFRVVLRKQGDLATLLRVTDQADGVHNVTLV